MEGIPEDFPSPVGLLVVQDTATGIRSIVTAVEFNENGMCTMICTRPLGDKDTSRQIFLPQDFEHISIIGCCFNPIEGIVFHKPAPRQEALSSCQRAKKDLVDKIHELSSILE